MNIQMIGIDHSTATVDIREKFAFTTAQSVDAMEKITACEDISGCIIISTCNRMEIWVSTEDDVDTDIYALLCDIKAIDKEKYRNCFSFREGESAVAYLFEMTSGLKSMIIGEDQILAQVKKSLENAHNAQCCDNVLEVLFRSAITGAKKVKTGLSLSTANASAVELAIAKMHDEGFEFAGKHCLVIGNGEMGKRTANALTQMGAYVTVTVRQYRSGVVEIPDNCQRINYGERFEILPKCDVIVSATSSPNTTIKYEDLAKCQIDDDKVFIDLAVPRDIDHEIKNLPHVTLYDIDDFPVSRTDELIIQMQQAEEMLIEQQNKFLNWFECRDLIPATGRIADYIAQEVDLRVGSVVKDLGLDKSQNANLTEAIDAAAAKVMKKLLFAVRDSAGVDIFRQCIQAMESTYAE